MSKEKKKGQRTKRDFHEEFFAGLMEELEKTQVEDPELTMKIGMVIEAAARSFAVKPRLMGKLTGKALPSIAMIVRKAKEKVEVTDAA